VSFLIILTETI